MAHPDVDRWLPTALAVSPNKVVSPDNPVGTALLEGDGTAAFVVAFWEPSVDGTRPGLSVAKSLLPYEIADEIASLVRAARYTHSNALFSSLPPSDRAELLARSTELLGSLFAACEVVLDDDLHEPADDALATAKTRSAEDDTLATMVQALYDISTIADSLKDRLALLGDFDVAWIAEAAALADKLSAGGPALPGKEASPEIDLRNRLLMLLDERVAKVRRMTRYVFRKHPDIIRLATSAYERRKRVEARRRKKPV